MGGDLPKVLHKVTGQPMLHWVIQACRAAGVERIVVVVGYKSELVREAFGNEPDCEFVEQTEQLGTGHAAQMAAPLFKDQPPCDVFVLAGDGPLIRGTTLKTLLQIHRDTEAKATLATSVIDDPQGYGRILRDADNRFDRIVEQKDATSDELAIREVNPSYYCFRSDAMFAMLDRVSNANASGEYYLTDVPGMLKADGRTVAVVDAVPPADVLSINTPDHLAAVDAILTSRLLGQDNETSDPQFESIGDAT
jgi:UDP-N-acetylglucosamine diphosphorylase/glucosamine-1-phosphate N-acetyltransferase